MLSKYVKYQNPPDPSQSKYTITKDQVQCSWSDTSAVGKPALVVSRLNPSSIHPEDILVGEKSTSSSWQAQDICSCIVVGPGETGGVTSLIGVTGAQLGTILPASQNSLEIMAIYSKYFCVLTIF